MYLMLTRGNEMHEFLNSIQISTIRTKLQLEISMSGRKINSPFTQVSEKLNVPDVSDRAMLEVERSNAQTQLAREKVYLNKLKNTLQRLEGDILEFGYCEECGIEIQYERLMQVICAERCVECQQDLEVKDKQIFKKAC